ncbi:class I adenylate-forming enzyme family protein [Sulfitobacter sp. 1A12126]|uniref:class I adenylate-forming enzyme family protein n=1 Tax=Sulfitobacter sp. 1A12126 TaxID=3368591 RepID=UPI003746E903
MNIASWLAASARRAPDAPALFQGTRPRASYGDLATTASAIGKGLSTRYGIAPGDRVALFLKNCPEYLEALFGIWWCGAVAVPVNAKLHPKEVAYILKNSGSRLLISDSGDVAQPDSGCREIALGDDDWTALTSTEGEDGPISCDGGTLAWLFYTSGTTGRPKGVMLTHDNLATMSMCYALDVDQVGPEQAILYPAPMSHGGGLYALPYIRAGARHVVPESRGFNAAEIAELARHFGEAVYFAAPTMIRRQVEWSRAAGYDGDGIRTIVYGGGPMYAQDIDEALELYGPRFAQIYGQGESPMTITAMNRATVADRSHPEWRARRNSVGMAQAAVEVRVVDEEMRDRPPGTPGEILVRGGTVMAGYWANEAATADTLRDGWLCTGDIGHLDADGFLTLTDRVKDVIISGGTNVYPREVEEVLIRHPEVIEAAVVGVPDPEWGERIKAFVVLRPESAVRDSELEQWCRSEMASFKKPSVYAFVGELPKNAYGKILKRDLRQTS